MIYNWSRYQYLTRFIPIITNFLCLTCHSSQSKNKQKFYINIFYFHNNGRRWLLNKTYLFKLLICVPIIVFVPLPSVCMVVIDSIFKVLIGFKVHLLSNYSIRSIKIQYYSTSITYKFITSS